MSAPVSEITIRRMTVQDVPAVFALDQRSFSLPWTERSFRYEVTENDKSRGWVAEVPILERPSLAAMLVLWLILDEAHIATLATQPEFRRQGLATRLLQTALSAACHEGANLAYLEVRAGNLAALGMYQQLGFQVVGRRANYYHDNHEDALLMTLADLPSQSFLKRSQP